MNFARRVAGGNATRRRLPCEALDDRRGPILGDQCARCDVPQLYVLVCAPGDALLAVRRDSAHQSRGSVPRQDDWSAAPIGVPDAESAVLRGGYDPVREGAVA